MLGLIKEITGILNGNQHSGREEKIDLIVAKIGEELIVDDCFLVELSSEGKKILQTYSWSPLDNTKNICPGEIFISSNWLRKKLLQREVVIIESAAKFAKQVVQEGIVVKKWGVQSILIVPVYYNRELLAFLGVASQQERNWDDQEVYSLQIIANSVALLIVNRVEKYNMRKVLHHCAEQIYDMICHCDTDFTIQYATPSFTNTLGYDPDFLQGKSVFSFIHPADVGSIKGQAIDNVKDHLSGSREIRVRHADGHYCWVEATGSFVYDDNNNYIGIVSVLRDITERKELEAQHQADIEYNQLRNNFFANISHELRTPLNLIFSSIQIIGVYTGKNSHLRDERLNRYLGLIKQNGLRLLKIVNNLIDITKIHSEAFTLEKVNYDIVALLRDIVYSTKDYLSDHNLKLEFCTSIKKKIMAIDPFNIERIILNLISNSVKFTKPGDEISISVCECQEGILISVKDTGIGIKKEKQAVIFEQFGQVAGNSFQNTNGSGLGLAIVKSLVKMHGGEIWLESEYGQGCKFFIKLPVDIVPQSSLVSEEGQEYIHSKQGLIEKINVEFADIYQ